MVLLMLPLLTFVKPRLPLPADSAARPVDTGFFRSPLFWTFQIFNIIEGTGYFLPSNYLPTYAKSLGVSGELGSLTIVLGNVSSVLGCILVGALMDRVDVTAVVFATGVISAAAIFAIWGVSTSIAPLFVFSLLYGISAGSYSTSWAGMIKAIQRDYATADTNVIFSFLAAGRGIGAVISGPLSEGLIASGKALQGQAKFAYGTEYGTLVIFAGCTALAGGFSWFARKAKLI
jgi:MFS family permease